MFQQLKVLELELSAHRIVVETIKASNAIPTMPWEDALNRARNHPALVERLDKKYKALSDQLLLSIDYATCKQGF